MNLHSPKYAPQQIISVYGQTHVIIREGVLDGGEYWYICRAYMYDANENQITWGGYSNLPEEDMIPLGNIIPRYAKQFFPGG